MDKPLKVFITYSHEDRAAKDKLITHLALLQHQGLINIWHDNEMLPGQKWHDAIFSNLADSDILLYLVFHFSLGERNTITKFQKKEFCQWICEQQNADHFANFSVIVDILKEFVEAHQPPSDQQPTSE